MGAGRRGRRYVRETWVARFSGVGPGERDLGEVLDTDREQWLEVALSLLDAPWVDYEPRVRGQVRRGDVTRHGEVVGGECGGRRGEQGGASCRRPSVPVRGTDPGENRARGGWTHVMDCLPPEKLSSRMA